MPVLGRARNRTSSCTIHPHTCILRDRPYVIQFSCAVYLTSFFFLDFVFHCSSTILVPPLWRFLLLSISSSLNTYAHQLKAPICLVPAAKSVLPHQSIPESSHTNYSFFKSVVGRKALLKKWASLYFLFIFSTYYLLKYMNYFEIWDK